MFFSLRIRNAAGDMLIARSSTRQWIENSSFPIIARQTLVNYLVDWLLKHGYIMQTRSERSVIRSSSSRGLVLSMKEKTKGKTRAFANNASPSEKSIRVILCNTHFSFPLSAFVRNFLTSPLTRKLLSLIENQLIIMKFIVHDKHEFRDWMKFKEKKKKKKEPETNVK